MVDYIDWTPFFQAWELAGLFPAILTDPVVGEQAQRLYDDAQAMLKRLLQANATAHAAAHKPGASNKSTSGHASIQARAVYGIFPANTIGDDIEVYTDESRSHLKTTLHTLRQQMDKSGSARSSEPNGSYSKNNLALADFIAPKDSGVVDYIGAFAVGIDGAKQMVERYKQAGDDYNAILVEALADRLAEAFAERLHKQARDDFGYGLNARIWRTRIWWMKSIAAFGRHRAIPPNPTTPRSAPFLICWGPSKTRGCN